jgi:hypothetical protein
VEKKRFGGIQTEAKNKNDWDQAPAIFVYLWIFDKGILLTVKLS